MKSDSVAECDSDPLVPVIVIVPLAPNRPPAALFAVSVNVDEDVVGFGENEPLRPVVKPVAESVTGPLKPLVGVIVTV